LAQVRATGTVPESLAPFFQEYRLPDLDLDRDAATVIERTLRYGSRRELSWLFQTYSEDEIAQWVRVSAPRRLPAAHRAFWQQVLQLEGG
jgi:hypothetical protein